LNDSPEPFALILRSIGQKGVAQIVATTAVVALPTVLLAFLYRQSRISLRWRATVSCHSGSRIFHGAAPRRASRC